MSCSAMNWGTSGAGGRGPDGAGSGGPFGPSGRRGGWRPFELAAMIGGFILFWPIGLAILAAKGWREGWWGPNPRREHGPRMPWQSGAWQSGGWTRGWGFGGGSGGPQGDWGRELHRDSGNFAFEDYKAAELKRLQAEFERLAADQRAFADHIEALRRAKDKAEFDSFIASRHAPEPDAGAKGPGEPPAS